MRMGDHLYIAIVDISCAALGRNSVLGVVCRGWGGASNALRAVATGDVLIAWQALKSTHMVSQDYLPPHLANHWNMLTFATEQHGGTTP
jgi:hypothetical protein